MMDPTLVLIPLLVLPVVLLFRFVGCGFDGVATGASVPLPARVDPLRYAKYLMGDPRDVAIQNHPLVRPKKDDIIGYWRLVSDGDGTLAKDETAFRDGTYKAPKDAQPAFLSGQKSLVISDTTATCRIFNGGFVLVPYKSPLYTSAFTIEAWLQVQFTPGTKARHTLFSVAGFFIAELDSSKAFHGFELFINTEDRWDAVVFPHVGPLFSSTLPVVPSGGPTHVALTVAPADAVTGAQQVTLFVDGKVTAIGSVGVYSLPNGAHLYIGASPATPQDLDAVTSTPILSKVQEVVLHKKALSAEEIKNHATFKTE